MANAIYDFFFDSSLEAESFGEFVRAAGLFDWIDYDPFPCENGSWGATISSRSSCIDDSDLPDTPDETAALELLLAEILREFPNVDYC